MSDFYVRDGEIYWKGLWLPRFNAERLLKNLRRDAKVKGDVFAPKAKLMAAELTACMAEAYQERIAA